MKRTAAGYALIALGFGMFMAGPLVAIAAGLSGVVVVLPAILGFFVMAGGGMALALAGSTPSRPATGGMILECPNCGAGAQALDADGFATCAYCGTRFVPIALPR